ncbi:MAG TPA: hypothetical protein VFE69_04850, partial [Ilumatobacteraceae bacterium]|nr:hypothetical protein [Ilumatobacteraceae bacterium]
RQFVVTAIERHQLPDDEDPDALAFELNGIILATNAHFVIHQDPTVLEMAKQVVRRRVGAIASTA